MLLIGPMRPLSATEHFPADQSLKGLVDRCWELGRTGQCASGLDAAELLGRLARLTGDERAQAEALNQTAWFCLQLGLPDRGHDAAIEAKRAWNRLKDAGGQALASAILSWILVEMGLVDEAFTQAGQALDLAERQADRTVLAFARNAKAVTYLYCRQDHLALPLLEQALATLREGEAPSIRSLVLTNIAYSQVSLAEASEGAGDIQAGQRWRRMALETNGEAIRVALGCGDLWNLRTALCNAAEYHACLGEVDVATRYLDKWQQLPGEIGLRAEIHFLYTKGEVLTKSGLLDEARIICKNAVDLADKHKQADHRANTNRRLADALEGLGDHQGALAYYKRFHEAFEAQMGETTRRRGQHVESTLENERLKVEASTLRFQAQHDALTGLLNRRSFEAALSNLGGKQFCLAIVDLDHFKSINDQHSHVVGDRVLKQTADILSASQSFSAYRLGGEEFALLFVDQSSAAAAKEAENTRARIAAFEWSSLAPNLTVTASIGLTSSELTKPPQMMEVADRMLYRAKASGRNMVVASDPT